MKNEDKKLTRTFIFCEHSLDNWFNFEDYHGKTNFIKCQKLTRKQDRKAIITKAQVVK